MTLRIAIRALNRNKVRSLLTMLGVIIGVASVITMVAIGQGATSSVQKQIESLGQSQYMILPGATSSGAVSFGTGSAQTLTPNDALAIERECPDASAVAIVVRTRAQLVYGGINWAPATVQGTNPDYLEARQWNLDEGEVWTEQDQRSAAQVCLIGRTIAEKVFGEASPVGQLVRVKNLPFKIVGVLEKKGSNTWGMDQDDVLLLPWTTCKKKLQGSTFANVDQIMVSCSSTDRMSALESQIKDTLRAIHKCPKNAYGGYEDDFTLRNMTEVMNAMASTTKVMTSLLAAVASISLLVGGVGIMNIMLVSVTERTREIGLRMAVGATGFDILSQFMVEAISLSGIGGLIGIGLGQLASFLISHFAGWPSFSSAGTIVIAVAFSAAVGCIFGFYPAWRASQLDPIEALRYE
jgi:putative ABC transport system permease protein